MEELGIPELNSQQIEELSSIVEKTAREHILSKVPSKKVETLNISVETEGEKPVNLTIDIEISLSPLTKELDAQKLADEAVEKALKSGENYLRKLACHSKK